MRSFIRDTPAPVRSTTVCAFGIRPMRVSGLVAAANLHSFMALISAHRNTSLRHSHAILVVASGESGKRRTRAQGGCARSAMAVVFGLFDGWRRFQTWAR